MNEVELGRSIQAARKKAGLTQQELCQKTGISYSTLAKIERGAIKSPSVFTVVHIAAVCGLTVEDLAGSATSSSLPSKTLQRARNGIQFIFFDINGCMVRFFQTAFTRIAADSGASPEVIEGIFWHHNDAVCRGEMPLVEFDKVFAEQLKMPDFSWNSYYLSAVEPIVEAQEVITWASQSFKVGLMSNITPGLVDGLLKLGKLPNIAYDAIVDSSKVGAIKPEPEIYEIAAKAAGVPKEDILLVDDTSANLMAAEKSGWHALWFDDFRPVESVERIKKTLEI